MRLLMIVLLQSCLCLAAAGAARAGEVLMTSGYRISFLGNPFALKGLTQIGIRRNGQDPSFAFTVVDAGPQRYYLMQSQKVIAEIQIGDPNVDEFELELPPGPRRGAKFESIGGFAAVSPFSEFGRRTVQLQGGGKKLEFVQEITKLRPDYIELTASKHDWVYAVDTKTIPTKVLRDTLSHTIDEKNYEDRLAIVRFFISYENYLEAQAELRKISAEFPDSIDKVANLRLQIRQLQATQALNEFKRRLDAGQYNLVNDSAVNKFPREDVNKATVQEVDNIIREHKKELEQIDQTHALLAELQVGIKDRELLQRFRDMRSVIEDRLSRHTLGRMVPFLNNAQDDFLSASEKLSLAYSGWIVGPALAETDAETTVHFWDAHDLVFEFLKCENPLRRKEILSELKNIESVGPKTIAAIVEHLGPVYETPLGATGQPMLLESMNTSSPVSYQVLLPVEYSPDRKYLLVVALHARGMQPQDELTWWGGSNMAGPAHRNGFIVIAPDYLQNQGTTGVGSAESHRKVVNAIRDARKRFSIDSDRVFLCGHGLGGDAVFDIGMAHPDLFAGAVSITGKINEFARIYWENCVNLPFYVVVGELDGDTFTHNAFVLSKMMKYRQDVILAEYKQRGHEDYHEELPRIIEWMKFHQRAELPKEFKMKTMRPSDNRFAWLEFSGLYQAAIKPRFLPNGNVKPPRPLPVEGKITPGNTVNVTVGANHATLWLTPELVSFEKRLKVRWKTRTMYNEFPEQNIGHMLEHIYITGDRQRLYWLRIDL